MKALLLSGGGSRGSFQLGALKHWMGDCKKDYDIIIGISAGALNAAGLSQTKFGHPELAIKFLTDFWLNEVTTDKIYKNWFPFGKLHSYFKKSIYDSSNLKNLLVKNVDISKARLCGRIISVGAVSLETGENKFVIQNDPNFIDWILASASYPIFFKPVKIDGRYWSDGAIKNITPISQAIKLGATEVDIIVTNEIDLLLSKKNAITSFDQVSRSVALMSEKIMKSDIKITCLKNELAETNSKYKKISMRLVMPSTDLNIDSLKFNKEDFKRLINLGYNDAMKNTIIY